MLGWAWGLLRKPLPPWDGPRPIFPMLAAFWKTKRSGRVLRAMGPNKQVRTQQSRASGAVDFLRYDRFCGPWRSPGVPGASSGSLRGVPGGPRGVPGGPRCVPGGARGVPGDPGDPSGLRGRPGHPWDLFHQDDSVIRSHNIIP